MPKVTAEEERVGAAPTKASKPKCADIMVWGKKLFLVKIFCPTFKYSSEWLLRVRTDQSVDCTFRVGVFLG